MFKANVLFHAERVCVFASVCVKEFLLTKTEDT